MRIYTKPIGSNFEVEILENRQLNGRIAAGYEMVSTFNIEYRTVRASRRSTFLAHRIVREHRIRNLNL